MSAPIKILSTDFDGTLHAEYEDPPIPTRLEEIIAQLQSLGATWVINTGRDLSSLMETLGRAKLSIWPDYVVTVEREIHQRHDFQYVGLDDWNTGCAVAHERLFAHVRKDVPRLIEWVHSRFSATVYEDPFSPFCLIARNNGDADVIHRFLDEYCETVPCLTVVRNDVYARFSHSAYNKGTALAEICRRLSVSRDHVAAAGDHLNDLPMLSRTFARWLISPSNAIPVVKETVRKQDGFVSEKPHGYGIAEGLEMLLEGSTPV